MKINVAHGIGLIAVVAVCTILLRLLPFLVFGRKKGIPSMVQYLGDYLPPAIMATLVVYCLRSVDLFSAAHGLPEIISVGIVIFLHLWKQNVIFSVGFGTICYMLLIRLNFLW